MFWLTHLNTSKIVIKISWKLVCSRWQIKENQLMLYILGLISTAGLIRKEIIMITMELLKIARKD